MKQRERLNCPNCGMPIVSDTCEYCGTKFFDFANIDINGESYLRIKIGGKLHILKVICKNVSIQQDAYDTKPIWDISSPFTKYVVVKPYRTLSIDFAVDPNIEVRTKECEKNV